MTSDTILRTDIERALDFEPSIDAAGIGVAVKDGVATLTGHVASYVEKVTAERVVGRVKHLRAIAEDIEVRLPFDMKFEDDEIARRAADVLAWSIYLPADSVRVKVEKGWVTLTGTVKWQYQKQAVENAVHGLGGVIFVSNHIKIEPRVTTADVHARITQAYQRNAAFESSGIKVFVEGGKITLNGRVGAWHERRTAEDAAWAVPGVSEVVDNLSVD